MTATTAYVRLSEALTAHGAVVEGSAVKASAQCPAHKDEVPSLSLTAVEGSVLVHCHAGCATADVLAALGLGMADLFDEPKPRRVAGIPAHASYVYDNGRNVVRSAAKQFRQTGTDAAPELYRLGKVRAAVAQGRPVYVVEGEKDVHALEAAGVTATCSPMGAGKWCKIDPSPLHGGKVLVIADQDEPGRKHAEDVYRSLVGCADVAIFAPKVGKDAADHIAAGYSVADLVPAEGELFTTVDNCGADLLSDVRAFVARFVAFPSGHALTAVTLWAAHAHLVDAAESTPRLALLSPEPGSGKTRTLEVLELLTPEPMHALNGSPAPIFRSIESARPTLLMDEVDAIFGRSVKSDDPAADLRALLNAGHRKGATIPRCVGPQHEVRRFPVYAAVALAGLGDLPETLMSRSIIVRMRRRAPGEHVEPFRHRLHAQSGNELRDRLADWAQSIAATVAGAWPVMPKGITDRPADCWEPLLAVADAAGGHWPSAARAACVELCSVAASREASLGVRLLGDLRGVWRALGDPVAASTQQLLDGLHALDEAPWASLKGEPLDGRGLARLLRHYEIASTNVKLAEKVLRGYRREHLWDAWERYCSEEALPALPRLQTNDSGAHEVVRTNPGSTTCATHPLPLGPANTGAVVPVAQVAAPRDKTAPSGCPTHPHFPLTSDGKCGQCILDRLDAEKAPRTGCTVCGEPLDPVIIAEGDDTHPDCDLPTLTANRDEATP